MNYDRPDLASRLAAEYVTGTMRGAARRRFERLMLSSPHIARAASAWSDGLAPLGETVPLARPRPQVWEAIEARTIARASPRAAEAKTSFWSRLFAPRMMGAVASGLLAGIAITQLAPLVLQPAVEEQRITQGLPGSYVGFMADASGQPAMLVGSLRQGKALGIKVVRQVTAAPDAELHLWALTPGAPPQRLGVVPRTGKGELAIAAPAEQLFAKVTELAVSAEPKGSTPAAPTEPFVLRGPCVKLW